MPISSERPDGDTSVDRPGRWSPGMKSGEWRNVRDGSHCEGKRMIVLYSVANVEE